MVSITMCRRKHQPQSESVQQYLRWGGVWTDGINHKKKRQGTKDCRRSCSTYQQSVRNPCLQRNWLQDSAGEKKKEKRHMDIQINIQSKLYNPGKFTCLKTPRTQSYSYFQMENTALPPQTSCRVCIPPPAAPACWTVATVQLLSCVAGKHHVFPNGFSIQDIPLVDASPLLKL